MWIISDTNVARFFQFTDPITNCDLGNIQYLCHIAISRKAVTFLVIQGRKVAK